MVNVLLTQYKAYYFSILEIILKLLVNKKDQKLEVKKINFDQKLFR